MLNLITMEKWFHFYEAEMSEIGQFCHVLCAKNTMEKLVPLSLEKNE
jgi:hypothetical protein